MLRFFHRSLQQPLSHLVSKLPVLVLLTLFLAQLLFLNLPAVDAQEANKADDKKPKIPAPVTKKMTTKDGVLLS